MSTTPTAPNRPTPVFRETPPPTLSGGFSSATRERIQKFAPVILAAIFLVAAVLGAALAVGIAAPIVFLGGVVVFSKGASLGIAALGGAVVACAALCVGYVVLDYRRNSC